MPQTKRQSLLQTLRRLGQNRKSKSVRRAQYRRLICGERLEDRALLATAIWNNPAGGNWDDKDNWLNKIKPQNGDDVEIPDLVGTPTITFNTGTISLNKLTSNEQVDIAGGTFSATTISQNAASFNIAGGTFNSGTLVAGTASVTSNSFFGTVTIGIGATLNVASNSSLQVNRASALTVNGSANFSQNSRLTLDNSAGWTTTTVINGTVTASQATFTDTATNGFSRITVNSGGRLITADSTFSLDEVRLNDGAVLNSGDWARNSFLCAIWTPAPLIRNMSLASGGTDNKEFRDINIVAGTLASGVVNLAPIGTVTTANVRYLIDGNFTVAAGATLNIAANMPLRVTRSYTFTISGAANFGPNSSLTLDNSGGWTTTAVINGTVTAAQTTFTDAATNGLSRITVNSGGRLIASDSTFTLDELRLNDGAVLNSGDWARNSFLFPIWTPAALIRNMSLADGGADNKQFQDINIVAGTLASGVVNLAPIGTVTTANVRYLIDGNFTVAAGATLNIAANMPLRVTRSYTFTISGAANFGSNSSLTLDNSGGWTTTAVINGTVTAAQTTFTDAATNGLSRITVNSGGRLIASDSTFTLDELRLNDGAILNSGDWARNSFLFPIWTPAALIRNMSFADGGADNKQFQDINIVAGILASGVVNLAPIGTVTTANVRYLIDGNFTVAAGATLNIAANMPLRVTRSYTFTISGAASFGPNSSLTLDNSGGWTTTAVINGTVTAAQTIFTDAATNGLSRITVNSGGRLIASDSTFTLDELRLNDGAVLNSGDWARNSFLFPIWTPAALIRNMSLADGGADNKQFQDINIVAGTLASGVVNLAPIGTVTTANVRYLIDGNFTVAAGATLNIAANMPLRVTRSYTFTISGAANFGPNSSLTLDNSGGWTTTAVINGTVTAAQTTFTDAATNGLSRITVNSGGRLIASDSTFTLDELRLNDGAVLNSGDWARNSFLFPIWTPAALIRNMSLADGGADNKQFQDINIVAGTLASGVVNLAPIGTVTTANVRYLIDGNFTVGVGATLNVASNIPLWVNRGVTFTVSGAADFALNSSLTLDNGGNWTTVVVINGTVTATGATFKDASTGGLSRITVTSGGRLIASDSTFTLDELRLNAGAILNSGDWARNSFLFPIWTPAALIRNMSLADGGADNKQFQDINIVAGTLASGVVNLAPIGTVTTANVRYLIDGNFTVGVGATLNVASNTPLWVNRGVTFTVSGAANFAQNSSLTLDNGGNWTTVAVINGTVTAAGATFKDASTGGLSRITVTSGGRLIASDSTFSMDELRLNEGAVLNSGDWARNSFLFPIWAPATLIRNMSLAGGGADNKQFQDINIVAGTLTSGVLNLLPIGTVTTANVRYLIDGNFTVGVGATLNVAYNIPLWVNRGVTFTVSGAANFAQNSSLTLDNGGNWTTVAVINGTVTATGASFADTSTGGLSRITVTNGGKLIATNSTIQPDQLVIATGATIEATVDNGTTKVVGGAGIANIAGFRIIDVEYGSALAIPQSIRVGETSTDTASLKMSYSSRLELAGSLLGKTRNPANFLPHGHVLLNGAGTATTPQLLEVMGEDMGEVSQGFSASNFVYGKLELTNNTYVRLTNIDVNTVGAAKEAIYVNSLVIPTGSRLDLNNLKLYTRAASIAAGSVLNGSIIIVPDGGPLPFSIPTPGTIDDSQRTSQLPDEWTFTANQNLPVMIQVNPGATGVTAALAPQLQRVRVELLDSNNNVLVFAENATNGTIVTLESANLTQGQPYKIRVRPHSSFTTLTGNYLITLVDSGASETALSIAAAADSLSKPEGNSGSTTYTYNIARFGDLSNSGVVAWAVTGSGTNPATAADFVGGVFPSGSVNFAAFESAKAITVSVATDTDFEQNEGFSVTLSNPTNRATVTVASASSTIVNDDQQQFSDLIVESITPPTSARSGQKQTLFWSEKNDGPVSLSDSWSSNVKVVNRASGQVVFERTIFFAGNTIASKASVQRSIDFDLADGTPGTGNFDITIKVDSANAITEVNSGGTGETNNTLSSSFASTLADYPALSVSQVTVPANVQMAIPFDVSWSVQNSGTGALSKSIRDRVYLSLDDNVDASDRILATVDASSKLPLAAGASYTQTTSVTLPLDLATVLGAYKVLVVTDFANDQFELNETDNKGSAPTNVGVPPLPDLIVDSISTKNLVVAGQSVVVSWVVKNQGTANATGTWNDRVLLSDDGIIGSDTFLKTFAITESLLPNGTILRSQEVQIPAGLSGAYRMVVRTDFNNSIEEFNREDNNAAIDDEIITIDARPSANLVIDSVTSLTSGLFSGQSATVDWVVRNIGNAATNTSSWFDRMYLSTDAILSGDDESLGQIQNPASLNVSDNYRNSMTVTLPQDAAGDYYFIVVTDATNRVSETAGEDDNTRVSAKTTIQLTPPPDLIVTSVTGPQEAFEGEPIKVSFTVRNQGIGPTRVTQWTDQVYLSLNGTDIDIADKVLTTVTHNGELAAGGAEYSVVDLSVLLPENKVSAGAYIIVRTDASKSVYEHAFEGNNDKATELPMQIFLRPRPELQVSSIVPVPFATAGQQLLVSYTVSNTSVTATRQNSWQDSIYLSTDKNLDTQSDILLGHRSRNGILAGEQTESRAYSFALAAQLTGSYYIIVSTDSNNAVPENDDTNNITASTDPVTIVVDPPDLTVTSVSTSTNPKAGRDFSLSYRVTNSGKTKTPNTFWNDAVYLSSDNVLDDSDKRLDQRQRTGALAAGQVENRSISFKLPTDRFGASFLIVKSDSTDLVYELNNNNNTSAISLFIEDDRPDLKVRSFSPRLGNRSIVPGGSIAFDFEVENQGLGATFGRSWTDRVVLSSDLTIGNSDDVTLGSYTSPQDLGAGKSYFRLSENVTIPTNTPEGLYRMYLVSDAFGSVAELDESNNTLVSADFSVTTNDSGAPTADLQVTALTVPAAANSGEFLPIDWTVKNTGTVATASSSWNDAVWLSLDGSIDGTDIFLGNFPRYGALGVNASYSKHIERRLDIDLSGDYFVIVQTDSASSVTEGLGENNNKTVSSPVTRVSLSPTPDLRVATIAAPAQAFSGRNFGFSWTGENAGAASAAASWVDNVYLSLDQIFDRGTDIPIGFIEHTSDLPAAQTYTANANFLIPAGLGGDYYLFVVMDSTNRVHERQLEGNNIGLAPQPINVVHIPPADLVVGDITLPTNGELGQTASITYTILNAGQNPARGGWTDSLYISSDDKWDIDDGFFGSVLHSTDVAANTSYTSTLVAPLPGVLPGNYKVIVRTDIRNNLVESDETNNLKASLNSFATDAPALTLGVAKSGTIKENGAVYYKVDVVAGETLVIEFDSATATGSTELYASFGSMPRRSQADFTALQPFQTDQRIVISTTQAGTYYIMAFGNDVENGASSFSILARIVPFTVFDTSFGQGGTAGDRTIFINGAKFDRSVTATLIDAKGGTVDAVRYYRTSDTHLYATFDLRSLDIGTYSVRLTKGTTSETILVSNSLDVVFSTISVQPISLTRPDTFNRRRGDRPPAAIPVTIGWRNNTLNDVPVPLIHFSATDPFASTLEDANAGKTTFAREFLGFTGSDGPKDILLSGEFASASFYVKPMQVAADAPPLDINYVAEYFYDDATANYNWDFDLSQLDLSYLNDDEALDAIQAFKLARGETVGALRQTLVDGLRRTGDLSPGEIQDASRYLLQEVFDRFVAERQTSISGSVKANSLAVPYKGLVVTLTEVAGTRTYSSAVLADGSFVFPKLPAATFAVSVSGGAAKAPNGLQIVLADNQHSQLSIQLESGPFTTAVTIPTRVPSGVSQVSAPWITKPGKINEPLSGNVLEDVLPALAGIPYRVEIIGGAPLGFSLANDGTYRYLSSQNTAIVVHYDLVTPDNDTRVGRLFGAEIRSRGVIAITLKNNATRDVRSADPNDIIGPVGYGTDKWVSAAERLPYTIRFENDPQIATSAAQVVVIEQILDGDLDTNSFQFGNFGFGGREFKVPTGRQTLNLDIDLKAELGIIVRVFARIDPAQRKVSWTFRSISPATGAETTNPNDGFLPLNLLPPQGDGFVSYTIRAKKTAPSGSIINARARIIFDGNSAIDTAGIFNTLDATKPSSAFASADPVPSEPKLRVKWTGDDGTIGAGLNVFDVYVSENNGRYRPWLQNTQLFEAEFPTVASMSYDFVTIARDNVGNNEEDTKLPDAHRPTANAGGPYKTLEGKVLRLSGSGQDPDPGQTVTFEWDFDYDGFTFNIDSTTQSPEVTFPDGPSIRTIGLRTKDNATIPLYSPVSTATVVVDNVVPNLTISKSSVAGLVTTEFSNSGSWNDVADDLVSLTASLGSITKNDNGTWVWTYTPTAVVANQSVTIVAKDKDDGSTSVSFIISADAIPVSSTLSSSNLSGAIYGQSIDFTVKLSSPTGNNPTGVVQFQIGGVNFGQPVAVQAGQATVSVPQLSAGTHQVVAVFTDPNGLHASHTSATLSQTVSKAPLVVTTQETEIFVGDSVPVFVPRYSGFISGDDPSSSLSGSPTFSVPANANTKAGSYSIVAQQGTLNSNNYSFQFQDSVLTVVDRVLSLVASPTVIGENGGVATLTITRNTPTTSALIVTLSSSDTSAATVPATVTIPVGAASITFTAPAVDDSIADGNQLSTITATASGFVTATTQLTVTDDEKATLTLTLSKDSVSENAGTVTGTITRNTLTNTALVVNVTSSNSSAATVPTTVTIAAGETSASFTITIINDSIAVGDQLSTIEASVAGFIASSAQLKVIDDESPTLALSLANSSIPENGGSVIGTINRNTPTTTDLVVNLSGGNTGAIKLPEKVTIPAGTKSATFTIEAINDSIATGNQSATITASAISLDSGSATLTVVDDEIAALGLSLATSFIPENGGSVIGTVTRNTPTTTDLVVNLSGGNTGAIKLPEKVTIPAGAKSATFTIEAINDSIATGNQIATITASAISLDSGSATLTVVDDEIATLGLSLATSSIPENGGSVIGTVTRNTPTTTDLVVNLSGGNTGAIKLPEKVTIPAGAKSATFTIEAINDSIATGNQIATITASVISLDSGSATLTVVDDEIATLGLSLATSSIPENGGSVIGTVTRNTPTTIDLVVNLSGGNTGAIKLPEKVTIPAGAKSATFTIEAINDSIATGNQIATITASAISLDSGSATLTVVDDETATLGLSLVASSIPENGGSVIGTVTRNTPTTTDLVVNLSGGNTGAIKLPQKVTIPAGAKSATFTIEAINDSIATGNQIATITASVISLDSSSATLTVVDDEIATLGLSLATSSIPENGGSVIGTVTRNTPTTTDLVVNLSSSNSAYAKVPQTVTIPAGASLVTFQVTPENDAIAAGNQTSVISASSEGFVSGSASLTISDDEVPTLLVKLKEGSISEKGGTTLVTITRNTPTTSDLTVSVGNSIPTGLDVPSSVVILAGQDSASFPVTAKDNQVYSGNVTSRIQASSAGYVGVEVVLEIQEDDPNRPWQNLVNRFDVNKDDRVSPIDALLVINFINAGRKGPLPAPNPGELAPPPYVDVNGDDELSPIDVLLVINFLNNQSNGAAEGESSSVENGFSDDDRDRLFYDSSWIDDVVTESRNRRIKGRVVN